MNRLQKKCFIASAGTHLLLMVILFVGPAFFSQKTKLDDIQELNFIPEKLVLGAVAGGGNPRAATRPPPPPVTPSAPPEQRPQQIERPKVVEAKQEKIDPESLETARERKPHLPAVSTKLVSRKSESAKKQKQTPTTDSREREFSEARLRAEAFNRAARSLGNNASSATIIDENFGPGGGGPTYASYASWVQTVYLGAWVAPDDTDAGAAVARASITIASDGTVTSYRLVAKSGNREVDESIQRTLERVTSIGRPFPEGMKEKQHTYILRFDLKAKQGLA
jgi:outer membrane biosynthesis protein TonB